MEEFTYCVVPLLQKLVYVKLVDPKQLQDCKILLRDRIALKLRKTLKNVFDYGR